MDKEFRNYSSKVSADDESRHIEGYCVLFNSPSQDLGYIERISPKAITEDTIRNSDIFCLWNHDNDKVLGRSRYGEGNLKLTIDEKGVKYSLDVINSTAGDDALANIRSGLVVGSSFAFTLPKDDNADMWERSADGTLLRTINKIDRLFDCSPCWEPAYLGTSARTRSLELFLEKEAEEKRKKSEEISKKYDNFLAEIDTFSIL